MSYVALVLGILFCGFAIDIVTSLAAPAMPYRILAGMAAGCSVFTTVISIVVIWHWQQSAQNEDIQKKVQAFLVESSSLSYLCNTDILFHGSSATELWLRM